LLKMASGFIYRAGRMRITRTEWFLEPPEVVK
jgi:hypothetical protein